MMFFDVSNWQCQTNLHVCIKQTSENSYLFWLIEYLSKSKFIGEIDQQLDLRDENVKVFMYTSYMQMMTLG